MKKNKELASHSDHKFKDLKIMNYKTQEQILFENAIRSVLSVTSNGHLYELNGNMKLVTKQCLISPLLGGSVNLSSTKMFTDVTL